MIKQLDVFIKSSETCKYFINIKGFSEKSIKYVFFYNFLFIYWTGADGRIIQGSDWFKSAGHDSSDYNEGSEDSPRSLCSTDVLDKEIAKGIDDSNVSEVPGPEFVDGWSFSVKKSKKLKRTMERAVIEKTSS